MKEPQYTVDDLIDELVSYAEYIGQTHYSKQELIHLAVDAANEVGAFDCFSCGTDTLEIDERYMVNDGLWRTYGVEGMLCIGCLEKRLGRRLTPADFIDCNGNDTERWPKSERLADRLEGKTVGRKGIHDTSD